MTKRKRKVVMDTPVLDGRTIHNIVWKSFHETVKSEYLLDGEGISEAHGEYYSGRLGERIAGRFAFARHDIIPKSRIKSLKVTGYVRPPRGYMGDTNES